MNDGSGGAGFVVLLGFAALLGLVPGFIAQSKGHSFASWWFFGFLLWIVALPMSLFLKDQRPQMQHQMPGFTPAPPAGWYQRPEGGQRYWDGAQWTEHTAP